MVSREEIEQALKTLRSERGDVVYVAVRPIVMRNNKNNRVENHLENNPKQSVQDYVNKVADAYRAEGDRIHQLLRRRSENSWIALSQKVKVRVRRNLFKIGIDGALQQTLFVECVARINEALLKSEFTYDTSFEAWLNQLISYQCSNAVRDSKTYKSKMIDDAFELDDRRVAQRSYEETKNSRKGRDEWIDVRNSLLILNPRERTVIDGIYFRAQTADELAWQMSCTKSAINGLHSRAKEKLRDFFGDF